MSGEIEKLESMRDVLAITSIVLMVAVCIMGISLIFITAKIANIYKREIESTEMLKK